MAEAETTTTEEAPQAPQDTELPAPPEPETQEGTEEEASPPDVGEALQQMGQRLDSISERLPEDEKPDLLESLSGMQYGDDPEEQGTEQPDPQEGGEEPAEGAELLRQLVREEAQEIVQQRDMVYEGQRREGSIRDLAKEHPRINEPEVLDAIAGRLEELGLQPQGFPPDPRHVEMVYKAYEAEAAASDSSPAEAASDRGATLETGAGPGAPPPDVDPQTQAWLDAIGNKRPTDAFSP